MAHRNNSLLPSLSIRRPTTVAMSLLTLLVVGTIAYFRIPIALFPDDMENPALSIRVSNPNSNPTDTEDQVTRKIEEGLGTVPGVDRILSTSFKSYSQVQVTFHKGVDISEAYANVRDRMDRVMPDLPDEVERIDVFKFSANDIPILFAAMSLDENTVDVDYASERFILPALQRIKGVGNVQINGLQGREIRIELDYDKIKAHNISVARLAQTLNNQNFNLSAGLVRESDRELFVRSVGRIPDLETFKSIPVDTSIGLQLGDIATIDPKPQDTWRVFALERERSYGIEITRSSGANIVQVCEDISQAFEDLKKLPELESFKIHTFWDQGKHVTESVNNLKQAGLWGGLFSIIVLYLFLRSAKMTLTITLAIPLSILASIVVLYFLGWSLNMATMMGLLLSVGLVVDNSIVIVENIHVKRELGMNPKEAALSGAGEMGLAITLATLTTIVVFLPLIVMGDNGEMQFWLLRIGVPVMLSLLASLVIALLLIPLATIVFAEKTETNKGTKTQSRLSKWYLSLLRWTLLQRSYASITIVALLVLSYAVPFKKIGQDLNSGGQQDVRLRYEFPGGQDIETIKSYFDTVYDYLDSQKPRYNFDTYSSFYWAEQGSIQLQFDEAVKPWYVTGYQSTLGSFGLWNNPHLTREEIVEDLRKNVSAPPGAQLRFNSKDQDPSKTFNIALYGDDTETLKRISQEVERRLRSVDGLVAVETEDDMQRQEMNITLDREKANHYGIETQMISGAISYAIRGNQVGYYYDSNGRRSRIRIWLDENDRESINHVRKLTFEGSNGALVPLDSLASLSYESGARAIRRQDRKTVMRVQGIATEEDSTELFKLVDAVMKDLELPRGYRWDKGGRYQQLQESNQTLTFTLLMIVVFIILLMGAMFESFILPFSIFLTMPLAGVGVVWTLYLTKTSFNIMASIGTIILLGVVVNNGIVLIDLITRLRSQGMERLEAIIEAGKRRFRPIWMTSLTTICGMIPMSLGDTKMLDMSYSPLGRAMMGGMLTATVLTLLVVPLFYTLFDDLRVMFFGYVRSIFQKTETAELRPESLEATD